ncbi:MAG: TlpA family protein disulfide reductase [Parvibaculaceae bacterium]
MRKSVLIAAVCAVLAVAGYVLYASGTKPVHAPVADQGVEPPANGVTRALATGTMTAFVVKPRREPAPDFSFQDGEGRPLKLSQWKGRVALVNLWATWCAPCRKEMPELNALQEKLGGEKFEIVALSVDRKGIEASGKFLSEVGATALKLYVDPTSNAFTESKAAGLPATLLIDREGREIGRLVGPAEWASPEAVKLIEAAIAE